MSEPTRHTTTAPPVALRHDAASPSSSSPAPTTTASTSTPTAASAPTDAERATRRLRTALGANALFSGATGAAALIAAGPLGRFFEVDDVVVRVLGAALVAFAGALMIVRRITDRSVLRAWALAASIADIGWVVGTVIVVAAGAVSSGGAIALALIAIVVGDLAAAQLYYRSRAG